MVLVTQKLFLEKRAEEMDITQAEEILGKQFGAVAEDANRLIQHLRLPQNAKILDVGTGMGYFAVILALNGYNVLTGEPESDNSVLFSLASYSTTSV